MCACGNCTAPTCNCADGADGYNIWTITTADFTQPNISSNVTISVSSQGQYSAAGFGVGQIIFIEGGGYYSFVSYNTTTSITVTNLGYAGNAAPAATVSSGAKVSPGGRIGVTGASGGAGTSLLYNDHTAVNSSGTGNQVLKTYTVPSGTLASNGDALKISGLITNGTPSGNTKTAGMYVTNTLNSGNTLITNYGSTNPTDKSYEVEIFITRLSATSISVRSKMGIGVNDSILSIAATPVIAASQIQYIPTLYKDITVSDLDANNLILNLWCNPTNGGDTMTGQFLTVEKLSI